MPYSDMNSQLHARNLSRRHPGSDEPLLQHPGFQRWLAGGAYNLWLRGSPGTGKSFFCSTAIPYALDIKPQSVVLQHFCRFDDQSSPESSGEDTGAVRVAALLVHQLFRYFWRRNRRISVPVRDYIDVAERTTAHLAELTRLILRHGCQLSSTAAGPSDGNPQCLFIFIDGLDEGSGKGNKGIDRILGVFQDLETELPLGCKIRVSSRETFPLRQYMDGWPSITADDMSEVSVGSFLNAAVPDLGKQLEVGREIKGKPREHPHPPSPTRLALSPLQDQGPKRKLTWRSGGMGVGEAPQQIKRKFPVRQVDG